MTEGDDRAAGERGSGDRAIGERESGGAHYAPSQHPPEQPHVLSSAFSRLSRNPVLFVPFLLAGLVLTFADWHRRHNPIPTLERPHPLENGIDITLEFAGYPTGVPQTTHPFESLLGLEPLYLLYGLGLFLAPLAVVTVAGVLTMGWAMERSPDSWAAAGTRLFGFVFGIDLVFRFLDSSEIVESMGLFGLIPLVFFLFLLVRFFAVPGALVAGHSIPAAVAESSRLTTGRGWSVFGLILLFGLSGWALATVPTVGTLLTTALIAPVHALTIVTLRERTRAGTDLR